MWFGSYGEGIYSYDGNAFSRFTEKEGLSDDRVRILHYSKRLKSIFAGTYKGLTIIRKNEFKIPSFLKDDFITGIEDAGAFIYVSTNSKHNPTRYFPENDLFISAGDGGQRYPLNSFSLFISSRGDTVFSDREKGIKILRTDATVSNDSLGKIFGITEDKRGDIWLAAWAFPFENMHGGLYRYNRNSFVDFKSEFGISDLEIWTVYADKQQDLLWVGTLNEGLFMVPFSHFEYYSPSYFGLTENKINDLLIDSKDRLWIAGSDDMIQMDTRDPGDYKFLNKHQMFTTFQRIWNRLPLPADIIDPFFLNASKLDSSSLPLFEKTSHFNFYRVIETKDHSFIFSSRLGIFSSEDITRNFSYLAPGGAFSELEETGDTLLLCGWGVSFLYSGFRDDYFNAVNSGKVPIPKISMFDKTGNPQNVSHIRKYGNQIWYSSWSNGLWMSRGAMLTEFNLTNPEISNNINDICFDDSGHVIWGTNSGEIFIATLVADSLAINYRIGNRHGLTGNSIHWVLADNSGRLWAGSNKGLNCIDLAKLYNKGEYIVRTLDEKDGYTALSSRKAVLDKSGNIWVASGNKLIMLNTKSYLSDTSSLGRIVLTGMEINQKPVENATVMQFLYGKIQNKKPKTLQYFENNIVFHFDIFNYRNSGSDKFRYLLEGYDKSWSDWNYNRNAVYTNLPPGRYTLKVESVNMTSLGKTLPFSVDFNILYPWWALWYVKLAFLIVLITLSNIVVYKYLSRRKREQQQRLEIDNKIAYLEMQALQAQMNPHFVFNCVSGIQYYILAEKKKEGLAYLSDFSKVVRATLANASRKMITIDQEIDFLNSYLRMEKLRFPDKFDYDILSINKEKEAFVMIPPMLIQPFVENAIRHGFKNLERKGHISIAFDEIGPDLLKCSITDNGCGRAITTGEEIVIIDADRPHSTSITHSRIRMFNPPGSAQKYKLVYTDLIENMVHSGLRVELFIPKESRLT